MVEKKLVFNDLSEIEKLEFIDHLQANNHNVYIGLFREYLHLKYTEYYLYHFNAQCIQKLNRQFISII